jgi:TfoX/Sxy family transcriptional regulator of competence genes
VAHDEQLAERIRVVLDGEPGIVEKKMFGGVSFLLRGNMCVGVYKDELLVRVAAEDTDSALGRPHTRPFEMGGRTSMQGWVLVAPEGVRTKRNLEGWVQRGRAYGASLPAK